jgi:small subunit ribosomal protein S1
VEALVHISELSVDHIANPSDVVEVGKAYKFKVVSVDIENHKLALSLKEVSQKAKKAPKVEEAPAVEEKKEAKKPAKKAKPE